VLQAFADDKLAFLQPAGYHGRGRRRLTLSVPSRTAQRLPHMAAHDVGEIDREIRDVLTELGEG
jgi:hypothetical protein